ncbi:MAG: hypothetical protein ACYDEY_14640, partial [Acidimicrobiales bacterium]
FLLVGPTLCQLRTDCKHVIQADIETQPDAELALHDDRNVGPEPVVIPHDIAAQSGCAGAPHRRMIESLTDPGAENGASGVCDNACILVQAVNTAASAVSVAARGNVPSFALRACLLSRKPVKVITGHPAPTQVLRRAPLGFLYFHLSQH